MLNNLLALKKSIESIAVQTFDGYEVWIVDGGSSDGTDLYLEKLEAPFFWISEKDKGIYDAMNKGIEKSRGEWLYFLGSGDLLNDKFILENIFSREYKKDSSILSGKVIYYGDAKSFIYSKTKNLKNPSWNFFMWIRNGLHHQGTFYKSNLFDNIKYDLKYPIFSDYWFNLLHYINKVDCFLLDDVVAKCDCDGISKSGNIHTYKEEVQFKVHLSSIVFTPVFYLLAAFKILLKKVV